MTTTDPREWLDGLDVVELDSNKLRTLAHPMRSRILSSLRLDGPATPSTLASRLGTNSGQTSYHLRALAVVGMVMEDQDRGTARERWWKAAQRGHSWSEPDHGGDPQDRHAAEWLLRHYHRLYTQWVSEWFEQRDEWPARWRHAAAGGDSFLLADPALLEEFNAALGDLLERFRERGNELDATDPDVHRVTFIHHSFPSDHVRP